MDSHPPLDDSTRDRARGALLGLAAGDAVGTTLEFKRPGSFTPIDDMVGGGPFGLDPGQWTDDTSMALCLAESVLDCDGHDPVDQLRRYVLWRHDGYLSSNGQCFDIGTTTSAQLRRFLRTGQPIDPNVDEDSAANGSLMRLAPVPIRWHEDPEEAAAWAAESSRTTHAARRPVDACRVLAAMTAALIRGDSPADVFDPAFWSGGELHPAVEAVARGSWRDKEPPAIRGTGYCVDALEAAIWAVAGADDFRTAILRAANLGDDADTTAAIAGQLAGARWGMAGIPARWLDQLTLRDRITSLADRLAKPDPDTWQFDGLVHAFWVEPGQLLAGEYPSHPRTERAHEKLDVLVDAGIRTFVDLTTPADPLAPYEDTLATIADHRALELKRISMPIPDLSTIEDRGYDAILDTIRTELTLGRPVYVHCWGGVGRTGTVIGCWLADTGLDADAVSDRLAQLRTATRKAGRPSPETSEQLDVIRRRCAVRKGGRL